MAMAVLRSHDCLGGRFRDESLMLTSIRSRRKPSSPIKTSKSNANPNPCPNSNPNHNNHQFRRCKRSPAGFRSRTHGGDRSRSSSGALVEKFPGNNLVMGEVKILKRGETIKSDRVVGVFAGKSGDREPMLKKSVEDTDLALGSTVRLGPDPETVKVQIKIPNRRSAFDEGIYAGSGAFYCSPPPSSVPLPAFLGKTDAATSDLRRLLQLD